jgi:hypothetical protein
VPHDIAERPEEIEEYKWNSLTIFTWQRRWLSGELDEDARKSSHHDGGFTTGVDMEEDRKPVVTDDEDEDAEGEDEDEDEEGEDEDRDGGTSRAQSRDHPTPHRARQEGEDDDVLKIVRTVSLRASEGHSSAIN